MALIDQACGLAARINTEWVSNPYHFKMIAASGYYMSQREQLSELSHSLVVGRRREAATPGSSFSQSKEEALRQIVEAKACGVSALRPAHPVRPKMLHRPAEELTQSGHPEVMQP